MTSAEKDGPQAHELRTAASAGESPELPALHASKGQHAAAINTCLEVCSEQGNVC